MVVPSCSEWQQQGALRNDVGRLGEAEELFQRAKKARVKASYQELIILIVMVVIVMMIAMLMMMTRMMSTVYCFLNICLLQHGISKRSFT